MTTFAESAARVLLARDADLAARWRARATAATPRPASATAAEESVAVTRALITCLHTDARCQGEVMRLGWADGAAAQAAGLGVHHVVKDADLLLAILLTAAEESAAADPAVAPTAADAFLVSRRLQRAVSVYAQAATSSYLHALVGAVRSRWRVLRHDLRNPLGTIQSALSLMEDESVPHDARTGPRVRAMMARNAGSLEHLIAAQLDDRVAESLLAAAQEISLRDVALAVRRALRDAAELAECEVVVDDGLPAARIDGAALELTLSVLLLAAIACARPGAVVRVKPQDGVTDAHAVTICVAHEDPSHVGALADGTAWDAGGLALARTLADDYGGGITEGTDAGSLELTLPVLPQPDVPRPSARRTAGETRVSVGHQRDDVARAD